MKLKNGTTIANNGAGNEIFGISEALTVTEGYDNNCMDWERTDPADGHVLTKDERIEFCNRMANRWISLGLRVELGDFEPDTE
jgi:hypothetical protein